MAGARKPYTELGKIIAKHMVDNNLSRPEVAVAMGISANLLSKMMHGTNYKVQSLDKVVEYLGDALPPEIAHAARIMSSQPLNHFDFEAKPGTPRDYFLGQLHALYEGLSDDDLGNILTFIAGGCAFSHYDETPGEASWIDPTPETEAVGAAATVPPPSPESVAGLNGTPNQEMEPEGLGAAVVDSQRVRESVGAMNQRVDGMADRMTEPAVQGAETDL